MTAELHDARIKVTAETHCALEALARATGKDRSEIAREVLHEWAINQIHAASVLGQLLRAEGLRGIDGGIAGNTRESQGAAGSAREKGARR